MTKSPESASQSPDTQENTYTIEGKNNHQYTLRQIGKGGEHIVYRIDEHPDMVGKLEMGTFRRISEYNTAHKLDPEAKNPEIERLSKGYMKSFEDRQATAIAYFGREHVRKIKQVFMQVPDPEHPEQKQWGIVRIQKFAPEFQDDSHLTIAHQYQDRNLMEEENTSQTEALFDPKTKAQDPESLQQNTVISRHLKNLLVQCTHDATLKTVLADFTTKAIQYTQQTGEILDLIPDNLTVFKTESGWDYQLNDAIYPSDPRHTRTFTIGLEKLERGVAGEDLSPYTNLFHNIMGYVRTINALAQQLEIPERLEFGTKKEREMTQLYKIISSKTQTS